MGVQHEELKEEFKEAHRATERIKSSGVTASEVRKVCIVGMCMCMHAWRG